MEIALPVALASASSAPRECNSCHRAPASIGYTSCQPCRDRRNETNRKARDRKREKLRLLQADMRVNLPLPLAGGESTSAGKKRKVPADSGEENDADVLERIRKRFKKLEPITKATVASKDASSSANTLDPVFEKYVVAAELHKAIKRRYTDNSTSLRFYGTYAIIALPDIDNKQRARQVARDLRNNTTLHFNLEDKKTLESAPTSHKVSYKCTCHTSMKRTASDISTYFGSKNKTASGETPKSECRGRIEIIAEDDRSHPLGWLGQRVKVTVTHPKKM
ncbi:hypothetical protein DFH06DRAFT_1470212 [Mycena polygramma]|nr:hypothetical protein DFH06DRAFT_1470212 [Mycena polygramma]